MQLKIKELHRQLKNREFDLYIKKNYNPFLNTKHIKYSLTDIDENTFGVKTIPLSEIML